MTVLTWYHYFECCLDTCYIKQSPLDFFRQSFSPSLYLLQNCVVVSFFDSDYEQIIQLLMAFCIWPCFYMSEIYNMDNRSLCIFIKRINAKLSCKSAALHKFTETWLTICEMQLIEIYFYTIVSFLSQYSGYQIKSLEGKNDVVIWESRRWEPV